MEFVRGESLGKLVRQRGVLTPPHAIALARHVLNVLEYLHAQIPPIIHRDVKPDNILINTQGQVFLVDLGIAKQVIGNGQTPSGAQGGTPGYAPPEQFGSGGTDARADLYALGATLYYALTAQTPTDAIDRATSVATLSSPRRFNSAISPTLEQTILYAMQIAPADRPQSASEMRHALNGNASVRSAVAPVVSRAPAMAPTPQPQAVATSNHTKGKNLMDALHIPLITGAATLALVLLAVLITLCFALYAMNVLVRATTIP